MDVLGLAGGPTNQRQGNGDADRNEIRRRSGKELPPPRHFTVRLSGKIEEKAMRECIRSFVRAYNERRTPLGENDPILTDDSLREWYDDQEIRPPVLSVEEAVSFIKDIGFGIHGMTTYIEFISSISFGHLNCDGWVEFASMSSADKYKKEITEMQSYIRDQNKFPFGIDAGTGAIFVFERYDDETKSPKVSVIDEGRVISSVFSDFEAMLAILTALFSTDVVLDVERGSAPEPKQIELVETLRSLDPEGFGKIGWPRWYRMPIGFY